jgi:hypothetical protein
MMKDKKTIVGEMLSPRPIIIGESTFSASTLIQRLDHHEGAQVPHMPFTLEGSQVLSSCSEYLASP